MGNPISLTADLSAETLQARKEWQDIFKVLKGKNLQPRLLYPARISFKIYGEIKSFSEVIWETRVQSLGQGRSPGEGNGNPLQCSCLENPMEGGAR